MVEKLKNILSILEKKNKPVWLFAFLKMDEFVDGWSLVFSAPWVNSENEDNEFKDMIDILRGNITDEELSSVSRIVFLPKDDSLVEELLKKKADTVIKEEKINGNMVHEGFIIESNPDLSWSANKILV